MKKAFCLFAQGDHTWTVIARDPDKPGHIIDTNEYVVASGNVALMTDPGGQEIFPEVFAGLASEMDPHRITTLFASHQDPDVISSLALWLSFNPKLRLYASWLWATFIPHFGGDAKTIVPIPDEGMPIQLGNLTLQFVPAHYLHSSGNFHVHDPTARILFSGDVGAATLPTDGQDLFVTDFDRHVRYAEGFHRRWMGSNEAKRDWCQRASRMRIDMLCPQHGAIYKGRDVERFINWFAELPVGKLRG